MRIVSVNIQLPDSRVRQLPIQHGQLRKYANPRANDQALSLYLPSLASHKKKFFLRKIVICRWQHLLLFSDSLWPHGLQHTRLPCSSLSPRVCSNSCSLSWWCYPTISSSVAPFSCCLQSFPASGSFPMSQCSASGGQSTGASASATVLPMNIQGWFPLGLTGCPKIWNVCNVFHLQGLAKGSI